MPTVVGSTQQVRVEAYIQELARVKGTSILIPWFLLLSYCYYERDLSLVTDSFFDEMCRRMLAEWPTLRHPDKHRISEEDLSAGTGYAVKVPERAKGAAEEFLRHTLGVSDAPTNPL